LLNNFNRQVRCLKTDPIRKLMVKNQIWKWPSWF
jgi:hypothetical protein